MDVTDYIERLYRAFAEAPRPSPTAGAWAPSMTEGRKSVAWVLVGVASMVALVSGGAFLELALPGGLPIGNALAAVALCAPAAAAVALSRPGSVLRLFSLASLSVACAWLPVSIGLAGNLALNFSGVRGQAWIWLSVAAISCASAALAWALADRLVHRGGNGEN